MKLVLERLRKEEEELDKMNYYSSSTYNKEDNNRIKLKEKGYNSEELYMDENQIDFHINENPRELAKEIILILDTVNSIYRKQDFPIFENKEFSEKVVSDLKNNNNFSEETIKSLDYIENSIKKRKIEHHFGEMLIDDLEAEIIVSRMKKYPLLLEAVDNLFGDELMQYNGEITKFVESLDYEQIYKLNNYANTKRENNFGQTKSCGFSSKPDNEKIQHIRGPS